MRRSASHISDFHDVEPPLQYSLEGSRAASSAMKESRAAAAPSLPGVDSTCDLRGGEWPADEHQTAGHERALRAASGAFVSSRARAESPPGRVPPAAPEATASAASAADVIYRQRREEEEGPLDHLPAWADPRSIHRAANESAQIHLSEPAYKLEGQDKRTVERAAAVSLTREPDDVSTTVDQAAVQRAILLQYAAQNRAAEAIAELPDAGDDYQKYYGTEPPRPARSRLSVRTKRTSSVGDTSMVDAERSVEIRNQMSTLRTKVHEVDEQEQKDREQLMEAARRNVEAAIHEMELRVYAETGKAPSSMQRELEEATQERVEGRTEPRTDYGEMVDLGWGQRMDPVEVQAAARLRVQPTLDQMDEQAEEQRAKEVEERLDREERKRQRELERQRAVEEKRAKEEEERLDREERKRQRGLERQRTEEEQRAKEEEERLDREERKRRELERQRAADTRTEGRQRGQSTLYAT
jgi:hypothetical protein